MEEWYDFAFQLNIMELVGLFVGVNYTRQVSFLQHLSDEYAGLDSEFSYILEEVMGCLYKFLDYQQAYEKRIRTTGLDEEQQQMYDNSPNQLCKELEHLLTSHILSMPSKKHQITAKLLFKNMLDYAEDELAQDNLYRTSDWQEDDQEDEEEYMDDTD